MQRLISNFALILLFIRPAYAQESRLTAGIYDDYSDDKVILQFDAARELAFSNIEFQYSTDSINFTSIYHYVRQEDSSAPIHISYLHTIKYIGKVYYRVVSDNSSFSQTITFDLGSLYGAVKVIPNPAREKAAICFNNKFAYPCSVKMANSLGNEVLSLSGYTGNKVDVDAAALRPGLYHFTISSDNGKLFFSGEMMVSH